MTYLENITSEKTSIDGTDLIYVVSDPAGTPIDNKMTLQTLLNGTSQVLNIVNYGAVEGDSLTNKTSNNAAMTAALTDLKANGGVLFIPAGIYWFDKFELPTGSKLVGAGMVGAHNIDNSYIRGTLLYIDGGSGDTLIKFYESGANPMEGVVIEDMSIYGTTTSDYWAGTAYDYTTDSFYAVIDTNGTFFALTDNVEIGADVFTNGYGVVLTDGLQLALYGEYRCPRIAYNALTLKIGLYIIDNSSNANNFYGGNISGWYKAVQVDGSSTVAVNFYGTCIEGRSPLDLSIVTDDIFFVEQTLNNGAYADENEGTYGYKYPYVSVAGRSTNFFGGYHEWRMCEAHDDSTLYTDYYNDGANGDSYIRCVIHYTSTDYAASSVIGVQFAGNDVHDDTYRTNVISDANGETRIGGSNPVSSYSSELRLQRINSLYSYLEDIKHIVGYDGSIIDIPRFLVPAYEASGTALKDISSYATDATLGVDISTLYRDYYGLCPYIKCLDADNVYYELADADELSMVNTTGDEVPFSILWLGKYLWNMANVNIFSKFDSTTGTVEREYICDTPSGKPRIYLYDDTDAGSIETSANTAINSSKQNLITDIFFTSAGDGNKDNLKIYVNGASVAVTSANTGTYTKQRNTTAVAGNFTKDASSARTGIGHGDLMNIIIIKGLQISDEQAVYLHNRMRAFCDNWS